MRCIPRTNNSSRRVQVCAWKMGSRRSEAKSEEGRAGSWEMEDGRWKMEAQGVAGSADVDLLPDRITTLCRNSGQFNRRNINALDYSCYLGRALACWPPRP